MLFRKSDCVTEERVGERELERDRERERELKRDRERVEERERARESARWREREREMSSTNAMQGESGVHSHDQGNPRRVHTFSFIL
jgi:hypothetical protein